jgi:hypothetical protein
VHAVFGAEVGDGRRRCGVRREVIFELRGKRVDLADVIFVTGFLPQPQLANVFQKKPRILFILDPKIWIELAK